MYQTLSGFLMAPFSKREPLKDASYKTKYEQFSQSNKINIVNTTMINDSWYVHLKVPSESNDKVNYDVVFRFFLLNHDVGNDGSLAGHKVQFFSNSPSFIYNYAWLYKSYGYLIEDLYNKMDQNYINVRPKKQSLVLSYDKSIYFCTLFLTERSCERLKMGNIRKYKVPEDKFFRSIDDVEFKNIQRELTKEENKLKLSKTKLKSGGSFHKKIKITSHKSTLKGSTGTHKIQKKKASKSTFKK